VTWRDNEIGKGEPFDMPTPGEIGWIVEEMKHLDFGDKRLEMRACKIIEALSQNPKASIPEFCGDWAATQAAYNFFSNDAIQREEVLAAQRRATLERMKGHELVLAIQDTSSFDFTEHGGTQGRGPLDHPKRLGFLVHSTLAASADGVPLGLLDQEVWVRDEKEIGKRHRRRERPIEEKESYKWLKGLENSTRGVPADLKVVVVSDRESDVFEYFVHPRPGNVELLIRGCWNRRVEDEAHYLWNSVTNSPVQGTIQIEVGRRPDQPPRVASCQIHCQQVKVRPPSGRSPHFPKLEPVTLWAVLLEEIDAPDGVEAICWLLLTTLEVTDFDQACQLVRFYTYRWLIERFYFVLKSGCAVEQRQLQDVSRLKRFLAVANVVAWRLLWVTYLGRVDPNLPCTTVFADHEWQALYTFVHKSPAVPEQPPSLQEAILWVAKLGGFLARKSDGPPGVKVLWRGWRRLYDISETWLLFNTSSSCGTYI
jgi:hypothetical protein